jgi:hypothetical protein
MSEDRSQAMEKEMMFRGLERKRQKDYFNQKDLEKNRWLDYKGSGDKGRVKNLIYFRCIGERETNAKMLNRQQRFMDDGIQEDLDFPTIKLRR